MNIFSNTLLMGLPGGGAGSSGSTMFLFVGVIIIMYFFMIRPQQKKAGDAKKFMESLQKGDKVVTVSGIHGRISKVNDNGTLEVEIDTNVKVVMERSGISAEYTKAVQDKK